MSEKPGMITAAPIVPIITLSKGYMYWITNCKIRVRTFSNINLRIYELLAREVTSATDNIEKEKKTKNGKIGMGWEENRNG